MLTAIRQLLEISMSPFRCEFIEGCYVKWRLWLQYMCLTHRCTLKNAHIAVSCIACSNACHTLFYGKPLSHILFYGKPLSHTSCHTHLSHPTTTRLHLHPQVCSRPPCWAPGGHHHQPQALAAEPTVCDLSSAVQP